jgi:hypothetical protein
MPSVVRTGELPEGPVDRFERRFQQGIRKSRSGSKGLKNDPVSGSRPEGR